MSRSSARWIPRIASGVMSCDRSIAADVASTLPITSATDRPWSSSTSPIRRSGTGAATFSIRDDADDSILTSNDSSGASTSPHPEVECGDRSAHVLGDQRHLRRQHQRRVGDLGNDCGVVAIAATRSACCAPFGDEPGQPFECDRRPGGVTSHRRVSAEQVAFGIAEHRRHRCVVAAFELEAAHDGDGHPAGVSPSRVRPPPPARPPCRSPGRGTRGHAGRAGRCS